MTKLSITMLPAAPLHAFEIWSNPAAVGKRFKAACGFALPALGRSDGTAALRLIRFEPTVWLVEGIVRIRLSGNGWRALLMEGGVFDAESPNFAAGCSAATIIDHVNVRLHVVDEITCDAYVPLSFSQGLLHFWTQAAEALAG